MLHLLILILIAVVIGYFFAKSRFSKPIDDTASKVTDVSKESAGKATGWFKSRFGKKTTQVEPTVIAASEPVSMVEKQPAAKQSSRRKSEEPVEEESTTQSE